MSVIGGWLLVPLVFALLCTGIGLLVEAAARHRVRGAFLPAVGLSGMIVVAGLFTILDKWAEFAPPVCAALAVAGLVLGRPWKDPRLRVALPWALGCAAVAFVIAALPSWLSGQASVLGYIKLDDSAIWLGLTDHLMERGRDIDGVPPSTFQLDLLNWLDQGYPVGSFTPLGVVAKLTGQELVNGYQPVITMYVTILALGLYGVARELVESPRAAFFVGVIGVQASMFLGYVAWGSIKEIVFAALLPALVGVGSLPVAALVGAALMCAFGIGGAVFVGPGLLCVFVIVFLKGDRPRLRSAVAAVAVFGVGVVPVLAALDRNVDQTLHGAPSAQEDLGKLYEPLDVIQGAGLWPAGDFRVDPDPRGLAVALAVLVLVLAAGALAVAIRRRSWTLPALLVTGIVGGAVALARGGPWIDAKVLAMVAPLLLGAAAALVAAGRRLPIAWAGAVILVVACAWSTFVIHRDVFVVPRENLAEQEDFADELAGLGPVLILNYEGYSTRYLLGPAQVEGASDLRVNLIPDRSGQPFPDYSTVEVDDIETSALYPYRTLIRRLTPTGSRPPSNFRLLRTGEYLEAWLQDPAAPQPLAHLNRSEGILPAAQVTCPEVRQLAATPSAVTLAAVPRANPVVRDLSTGDLPGDWLGASGVRPHSDGTARISLDVPEPGRYRVFVGGQALGELAVRVDGEPVGSVRHRLDASVGYMRFGSLELEPGPHTVALTVSRGGFWRAGRGNDASQLPIGPVVLARDGYPNIVRVPVADADQLCDGRTYDWLEALPG